MVFQKFVVVVAIVVHANGEHGYALILHLLLHLHQRRHFFNAWRTPGGPKIQHDNFAAQLAQGYAVLRVLNGEIRSGIPDTGRLGAAITAAQHQGRSKGKNEDVVTHTI